MCTHFVAAVPMEGVCHEGGPCLQGYYSSRGLAVLGTVMDGDCGIDVACQMLGLPQTPAQRAALREEISDYLLARVNKPWMQEVMGTLQEVNLDDVRQILREPADAKWGDTAVAVAKRDTQPTAVAVAVEVADQDTAEAVVLRQNAIKWVTKSKDHSFIANVVDTLPAAVAYEQARLYQASKRAAVVPHAPRAIVVYPHLLKSRQEAAQLFAAELRNEGGCQGHACHAPRLLSSLESWCGQHARTCKHWAIKATALRRWPHFFGNVGVDEPSRSSGRSLHLKHGAARPPVEYGRRQRI